MGRVHCCKTKPNDGNARHSQWCPQTKTHIHTRGHRHTGPNTGRHTHTHTLTHTHTHRDTSARRYPRVPPQVRDTYTLWKVAVQKHLATHL